jgi:hypothetical protein
VLQPRVPRPCAPRLADQLALHEAAHCGNLSLLRTQLEAPSSAAAAVNCDSLAGSVMGVTNAELAVNLALKGGREAAVEALLAVASPRTSAV